MIDIETLKPGTPVWILHQNRPVKFVMRKLEKIISDSGVSYHVEGEGYSVPADWCFSTELELIENEINYWRDMRLNYIVKHGLENLPI